MTDSEFYKKILSCQSWLINRISENEIYYKHWSDKFYLKKIRDTSKIYFTDDYIKEVFKLDNLTKERVKVLRFGKWSSEQPNFYLFPLWFTVFLPYGTKVVGIDGNVFEYTEETNLETKFGHVAFGIKLKQ